jgi:hypothetical protein
MTWQSVEVERASIVIGGSLLVSVVSVTGEDLKVGGWWLLGN